MRIATFAVVLFAIGLAAPGAAQTAYTVPCGEASDSPAVWRFYPGSSSPSSVDVYDFEAQSNLPDDRVSLYVEQYAPTSPGQPSAWTTMLATSEDNPEPFAQGSTSLRAARWTDVGVRCDGNGSGEVTLNVTRRTEVPLRRQSGAGYGVALPGPHGPHTLSCEDGGSAKWQPGLYRFDPTLYLRVQPSGARAWTQRIHVHGRPVERGLGGWPVVGVEEARLQALSNRRAIRAGQDPFRPTGETDPTFETAAAATRTANVAMWAASTLKTFDSLMRAVLPLIGNVPVGKVSKSHVIDCLTSINRRSTATARKAKKAISTVLELAVLRDWASINVAKNGGLDAALPFLRETGSHHAAADPNAVGRILASLARR